jgi:ribosomal protein S18 acetylase RimI-like enzyme
VSYKNRSQSCKENAKTQAGIKNILYKGSGNSPGSIVTLSGKPGMQIRRANREDVEILRPFVQMIVDEVHGYLWQIQSSLDVRGIIASRIAAEDWSKAWVAFDDRKLVGTVLTHEDWIDDLWVLQGYRGRGIGKALLLRGEEEIIERGYEFLRLRMVQANTRAFAFYQRSGWNTVREFPHETFPFIPMLELQKAVPP